ncbi:MAG: hypothetical protein IPL16_02355 [Ignavibacteria bacterium]|nr:hypothetical protein [Ignavibacteria bacterium]
MESKKNLRTCKKGHQYYKSSDCPVCPICGKNDKPEVGFLSLISAPARRALENKNIKTLKQLSKYSVRDILELHGIGKTTIPVLKMNLKMPDLHLKTDNETLLITAALRRKVKLTL